MQDALNSQVLELIKNIYGLKQASCGWFETVRKGLEGRVFIVLAVDLHVFMKRCMKETLYIDDMIVLSRKRKLIDDL